MKSAQNNFPRSRRQYFFDPRNGNITYGKSYGEFSYNGVPIEPRVTDFEGASVIVVKDVGKLRPTLRVPESVYKQILDSRHKTSDVVYLHPEKKAGSVKLKTKGKKAGAPQNSNA